MSSLELFFDLVFVFTITQLTNVLVHALSWKGLLQVSLMLGLIFWMYGGYAWLTNSVALDRITRRLTLLGGMGGFFVVALAIPGAFAGSGTAFGLAYIAVVLIHMGMFARSSPLGAARAILGLLPFNFSTALLVLAGGLLGGTVQYALWAAAFVLEWVSPKLIDDSGFVIEATHFVERHGLVVLVAIGESVVAVGIGASRLDVSVELVAAAILGLAMSACLWWSYFGFDDESAREAIAAAPVERRPQLVIDAYGYWHLLILIGIIAIAFALKTVAAQAFSVLPQAQAIALGAGASVFLLGEALFRRTLRIEGAAPRVLASMLALATIPLGTEASAATQLVVLVALFVAMLAYSDRS
ncbi:MAG TPA: low temperature requirement protein A [Solirubrobacteraceae bacterium]|nr:low temperature requirement protein A [Solirubrobacteraceae bacterium]